MGKHEETNSSLRLFLNSSAALLAVKLFLPLSFFTITVAIARLLGTREFGVFAIVMSYYAVFKIISTLGVDSFLLREIPKDEQKVSTYLDNTFLLGSAASFLSIIMMNASFHLFGYSDKVIKVGMILSLALLPDSLTRYCESVFIALGKTYRVFITVCFREIIKIMTVLAALFIYKSLIFAVAAISLSNFLGLFLNLMLLGRNFIRQKIFFDPDLLWQIFRICFVLAVISGMNSLFLVIDVIVLSKIKGEIAVGLYSAAYKFITLGFLFIDSFGTALVPVMSRFYQESQESFQKACEATFKYLLIGVFLFIVTVSFLSDKIVVLFFGKNFISSVEILTILIWSVLFLGNSYFLSRFLFIANKQKYDLITLAISCVINLVLNIPFTICWGYFGTALATVISTAFLFLMQLYFFSRKVIWLNMFHVWIKPLIAGLVFFVFYFWASKINRCGAFVFATTCYFLILIILKIMKKQEIKVFSEALLSMLRRA